MKAIAEPNRRRILELVADDELTAGDISEHFDVTRPAISQHLTVLKQAGLIGERRQGTRRLYRVRPQGFAEAKLFLEAMWDDRLWRLSRAATQPLTEKEAGIVTETVAVHREMFIAATPEVIWELLSDAEQATRWMGQSATFDLSPGGSYQIEVVPGQVAVGEYIHIDPPHQLAFTWGWEGDASVVPTGSTIVMFDLIPTETGTLLTLTHRELPTFPSAGSHSRGWSHYLERLATLASGGSPGPDPWTTDPDQLMAELRPGEVH